MPEYKIIASDLDGTLLNSKMEVSPENLNAIYKMTEMGIHFVPSSGRTLTEIPDEIVQIPGVRYIIHSDGAVIYDRLTGKRSTACMNKEKSGKLLDLLNEYRTLLTVRYEGVSYVDALKHQWDIYEQYRLTDNYKRCIFDKNRAVEHFRSFCRGMDEIEMICAFFKDDNELNECRRRILATGEYKVASSEACNLEIFDVSAGKGNGLVRLSELLGVPCEETIGVGDSTNDKDNLEKSGLALAMENADDELKQIAHRVICNNNQHAMKYILENIIK